MSRLIREDLLTETIKKVCCHAEDETDLLNALKEMHTIDAVEVVRCKDCIHFEPFRPTDGFCKISGMINTLEFFCADGERKHE